MWSRRGLERVAQTLGHCARHFCRKISDNAAQHHPFVSSKPSSDPCAKARDHVWDLRSGELLCQLAQQVAVQRDPMVPLRQFVWPSTSRTAVGKKIGRGLVARKLRKPTKEMSFYRKVQLFLSVHVEDKKMAGRENSLASMWFKLKKKLTLRSPRRSSIKSVFRMSAR